MGQKSLKELVNELGKYGISSNSLARICGINPGQMRHYVYDVKKPSTQTIRRINDGVKSFACGLQSFNMAESGATTDAPPPQPVPEPEWTPGTTSIPIKTI